MPRKCPPTPTIQDLENVQYVFMEKQHRMKNFYLLPSCWAEATVQMVLIECDISHKSGQNKNLDLMSHLLLTAAAKGKFENFVTKKLGINVPIQGQLLFDLGPFPRKINH